MKKILIVLSLFCISFFSFSQNVEVYPSNWWVGMKWNKVQLMLHKTNISNEAIVLSPYPGVTLVKVNKVENPNYVFVDLSINSSAKPGKLNFKCSTNGTVNNTIEFELKARRTGNGTSFAQGVTSKDFV